VIDNLVFLGVALIFAAFWLNSRRGDGPDRCPYCGKELPK